MNPEQEKIIHAIYLGEQGQTEQAIKILQGIKRPRDAYVRAQLYLGTLLSEKLNKLEEAKQAWKNIKRQDLPEVYAEAQHHLGRLFQKQGKLEEAEQAWKNVEYQDSHATYADAQYYLGRLFQKQGRLEEAEQAWKNVEYQDSHATYAEARADLGSLYYKQEKLPEAEQVLKNVKDQDSHGAYADAQVNLGLIFHQQNRLSEAEQAWKNVKHPCSSKNNTTANVDQCWLTNYVRALGNLGILFYQQGKLKDAEQAWKNIKREDSPEAYVKAQSNLSELFYQQGELKKVEQAWKNIEPTDSPETYAKAQFNLGVLFNKQGKIKDAEQAWKNIKKEYSPKIHALAQFNLLTKTGKLTIKQVKEYFSKIDKDLLPSDYNFTYEANKSLIDLDSQHLLDITQSVHQILQNLALDQDEDECQFAHYTRPSTAHLLLSGKSPFRLNTIANVNDPTEGEILNHYLNHTLPENSKQAVFISCFTFNHDSLNQFRLYGKEDGQEASGCSMVLDKGFFHSNTMAIGAAMGASNYLMNNSKDEDIKSKEIDNTKEKEQDKPQDKVEKVIGLLPLYRCIYIDKQNPQYVRLACRDEVTFYREFPEKTNEAIAKKWKEYQDTIQTKQENVIKELDNIRKSIYELNIYHNQDSKLTEALNYILLPLQYLVKHAAFQEEQECRMFYITDWSDEHIQTDFNNHWLYVNYSEKPLKHLQKIYLSPGAMQHQHFFDILVFNENKKKGPKAKDKHAKVCHSSNPFRNG